MADGDGREKNKPEPAVLKELPSYLLNRISHRYNKNTHEALKAAGLTTITTRVLVSLKMFGPLSVGELCVHAIAEQPTMSRALDRLEAERLVRRAASDEDSRMRVVRLTAAGEKDVSRDLAGVFAAERGDDAGYRRKGPSGGDAHAGENAGKHSQEPDLTHVSF